MTKLLAPALLVVVTAAGLTAHQLQEVSTFAAGEFPLTMALGVDRSWSMAGDPLRMAKQASQAFLRVLKPGDRSMVVAISTT